jgi:hypothetical protein
MKFLVTLIKVISYKQNVSKIMSSLTINFRVYNPQASKPIISQVLESILNNFI